MSDPKNHHYVPICYSKNFTTADGFIFIADKWNRPACFRTRPAKAFRSKYLYTQPVHAERRFDNIFERYFSGAIESRWTPLYRKIQSNGALDEHDIDALVQFIALQKVRVPISINATLELLREKVLEVDGQLDQELPSTLVDAHRRITKQTPEGLRSLVKSGVVKTNVDPHRALLSMPFLIRSIPLFQSGFRFGNPVFLHNVTNLPFVSSDNPICYSGLPKGRDNPAPYSIDQNGGFRFIFPMSSNIVMVNRKFFNSRHDHVEITDSNIIAHINRIISSSSYRYIFSKSKNLSTTLAERHANICPRPVYNRSVVGNGVVSHIGYSFGIPEEFSNAWQYEFARSSA